ncbi:MAG TPA: SRPBCC family protein [Acidimicrobiia bacterium]|nr:SRPBCC family protein [Acidimicrobiia bacterium]
MQEFHGTATNIVAAAPDEVFRLVTDIDRLPEWNRAIECVTERAAELMPGAEWTVKMHPSRGLKWFSRSRVEGIDAGNRCFRYRTWNADGNPSYTDWTWMLGGVDAGTQVSVTWNVTLKTLDRRLLAGPIRKRQLRREVAASLVALGDTVRVP